jgi:LysM repeat protein
MKNYITQSISFPVLVKPFFMIKWLNIILFIFLCNTSFAQKSSLIIEGTSPALYIIHKVTPKENFYSIGRMYNVPPKDLASYNNLHFEKGLSVGESLKIPLSENNFLQSGTAASNEALIPVYHHVQPKEGLYRVSINYNKVPLSSIKKWNHLTSDDVGTGVPLIVGYLRVDKTESSLAVKSIKVEKDVVAKNDQSTPDPAPLAVNAERLPPVKKPDEPTEKKEAAAVSTNEPQSQATTVNTKSTINFQGGYFKKSYDSQAADKSPVSETGSAGVFKSTSGWQDGRYYCFNNNAAPGTVIKIVDYVTGKSVYAKVLDAIPDIKQNSGLTIIISNSAAKELGAETPGFNCSLSYVK